MKKIYIYRDAKEKLIYKSIIRKGEGGTKNYSHKYTYLFIWQYE